MYRSKFLNKNKKQIKEANVNLKSNILINSKPFILELSNALKSKGFNFTVSTKKITGSKGNVRSFYKTFFQGNNFEIEILHFLGGVAFIYGSEYSTFTKTWYSFDDIYAQDLKKYRNAEDIIQQILIDLTV